MKKVICFIFALIGFVAVVAAAAVGVASLINKVSYVDQLINWINIFLVR